MSNLKHALLQTILLALLMTGVSFAGEPAQGDDSASGSRVQTDPSAPASPSGATPSTPSTETSLTRELRELREQLSALRQETARAQAAAESGGDAPIAATGPATPANPDRGTTAPQAPTPPGSAQPSPAAETSEVESLRTQVRALSELKSLREDLAKLRTQIQLEKDALQGQASGAAGFVRPALSTWLVKDEKGRFGIWVNPTKWTLSPYRQNPESRVELAHRSGDAYVFVFAEDVSLAPGAVAKMALKNAQTVAPDAHIVLEDKRTVNGVEVTCLQIEGTLNQALPFTYLGYYYSGKGGTIQVVGSTARSLFDKYEKDLYELLNGLEIYEAGTPPTPKS